jgi:methylmalonyl-CoA mutase N-terminal domain/subunit
LALRTQQIIAHESGVTHTADPVGGSYAIEQLTDEIERGARGYIERIDAMGGTLAAIEKNYIQNEIQNAAYEFQQKVETGEAVVVGVNRFKQSEGETLAPFRLNPELEQQQIERVREVRSSRSRSVYDERLQALEQAARSSDNLMPHILSCAEAHATVGEISDRLRAVFGEYRES